MKSLLRILAFGYVFTSLLLSLLIWYNILILDTNTSTESFGIWTIPFIPGILILMIIEFLVYCLVIMIGAVIIMMYMLGSLFALIPFVLTGEWKIAETFDLFEIYD